MPDQKVSDGNFVKAVFAALLSFLLLATVSILVKLEVSAGATIEWIVFIQYFTCLLIITSIASKNKFQNLRTQKIRIHIIRGLTGVLAFTCTTIAITKIPLVNASLLNNTAPLFIPFISLIWLKNKIDEKIWWGILIGFIGIICILRPGENALFKEGDLYGLASGVFLAITYVALKILTKTESFVTVLFYYSLIATLLSFPFAIFNWSNPPLLIWIYAVLTGVFFICYMYMIQFAYKLADAVRLSPFNYSVIVFTGIFDWLIFDHVPEFMSVIGMILVTAGGILAITLHEKSTG